MRRANLDLRSPAGMLKGGDSGPAFMKGDADKSLLFQQVSTKTMPPGKATKLTDAEVARIRDWINSGARTALAVSSDGLPWSFRPVVRPHVPHVERADRQRTPIDAFVRTAPSVS